MAEAAAPAETWTVATFNVVGFSLLGLLAGHASGALADALPGVGTVPGVLLFAYLWTLVVVSTRWVFAAGGLRRSREGQLGRLLARGTAGGALVGAGFVVGIVAFVTAVDALSGAVDVSAFALLLLFGAAGGAVVGSVVGAALGIADVALYRASSLLAPPT